MTAHQTKALVLSLLLHALFLSCALVFAGNAAPLKPPVRIELAIGTAGSGGAGPRTAAAPVQEKVEPAAPRPRQVVKTKPVRKKTSVRPQQVAAVRKPAPAVQPTRSTVPVPAPPSDPQPVAESVPQAEPASAASEPAPVVAAAGTGSTQPQAGAGTGNAAGRDGSPVPAGSLDGPLQALARTQPGYPPAARRQNVEGWIRVQYVVDERGSVGPVKVLAAEPEGFFEQSVLRTVRAWRFRPGTVNGEVVQALVEQTISFRLR